MVFGFIEVNKVWYLDSYRSIRYGVWTHRGH